MEFDTTPKSVWNFDEARMRDLNYRMVLCEEAFAEWNLESLDTHLHTVKRVVSGALGKTEFDNLKTEFDKLEAIKREIATDKTNQQSVKYYNLADEIFIKLNQTMQKLGFFFRKGDNVSFAALKR